MDASFLCIAFDYYDGSDSLLLSLWVFDAVFAQ